MRRVHVLAEATDMILVATRRHFFLFQKDKECRRCANPFRCCM
jgi:hypothetical protein